jgi:hypothetical protein
MAAGGEEYINGEDADMQHDEIDEVDEYDQPGLDAQEQSQMNGEMPPMGGEEMPPADDMMGDTSEHQGELMEPTEDEEPSTPFQNEFRTITSKPMNQQHIAPQGEDEDEDLFSDAAETRTKKLGY